MAVLNERGNIIARCPLCEGAKSTFVVVESQGATSVVHRIWTTRGLRGGSAERETQYRLFRCNTCGMGAVAAIEMSTARGQYPGDAARIEWFHPESGERLPLPEAVPDGIRKEFREAERCADSDCLRAAAAMFRSVLEKTLRANGYDTDAERGLMKKIAAACDDGVITQARRRRADEDVRVLGNDILHEEWCEVARSDVDAAHHYTQRILEDLYDDREVVLRELNKAGRKPPDAKEQP